MKADVSQIVDLAVDLTRIGADVPKRAALAVRKSAADVEAHGKARAAVDTGNMRGSIGVDHGTDGDLTYADIGPTADYAPHVEFGTRHMAPQPFMMPAADAVTPSFLAGVAGVMKL